MTGGFFPFNLRSSSHELILTWFRGCIMDGDDGRNNFPANSNTNCWHVRPIKWKKQKNAATSSSRAFSVELHSSCLIDVRDGNAIRRTISGFLSLCFRVGAAPEKNLQWNSYAMKRFHHWEMKPVISGFKIMRIANHLVIYFSCLSWIYFRGKERIIHIL